MPYPWSSPLSVASCPEDIISIFGVIVYHVPGLCLLGIGGAYYIKLWPIKHIFTFFTSQKPPADRASYYARRFPKPRPSYFFKL